MQRQIIIPEQLRSDLYQVIKLMKITQTEATKLIGIAQPTLCNILNSRQLICYEDTWNKLINFLASEDYEKRYFYPDAYSSQHPTNRPGLAHLDIQGKLLCGETKYGETRYYRKHTDWLNQVEICPKCLRAWQKAEAVWQKNQ